MLTPITVNYQPDGDDWKVSVTQDDKTLTGRAPGLIAARDTADQLVEKLAPKDQDAPANTPAATVVHLLEGDPVAFSTAYLHARHGGLAGAPTEEAGQQSGSGDAEYGETAAETAAGDTAVDAESDEPGAADDKPANTAEEAAAPEQDSADQQNADQQNADQENAESAAEQDASEAADPASDGSAALAKPALGGSAHGAQDAAPMNGAATHTADGQTVVAADDTPEPAALS